jgi:hypothetical protein
MADQLVDLLGVDAKVVPEEFVFGRVVAERRLDEN